MDVFKHRRISSFRCLGVYHQHMNMGVIPVTHQTLTSNSGLSMVDEGKNWPFHEAIADSGRGIPLLRYGTILDIKRSVCKS